jgi:hypothetical protein
MKEIISIDLKSLDLQSQVSEFSRKVKEETLIRSLFSSFKPQIKGHPKKEYLRCKLIRSHKRANRKIKKGKFLYNCIKEMSYKAKSNWQDLAQTYHRHPAALDAVARTVFEPVKFKARAKPSSETSRSFNTEFCQKYFANEAVRESFYYFVEYIFSDLNPNELAKVFGFTCCEEEEHQVDCAYRWLLMKRYANQLIIEDLGLSAWVPTGFRMQPGLENFVLD